MAGVRGVDTRIGESAGVTVVPSATVLLEVPWMVPAVVGRGLMPGEPTGVVGKDDV